MSITTKGVSAKSLLFVPLLFLASAALGGATPDFSGTWVLDASQSPDAHDRAVQLNIQQTPSLITFRRVDHEGGRERVYSFSCAPLGTTCDFDEDGHKAKVQLWYQGSALVIAKTDGRSDDATTERTLSLSQDGKTLTIEYTNYSSSTKPEKLVFTKQ